MNPLGFLVVDKPQGLTSHDVVAKVRRGIGVKRIGHAGTLDPMATGVLVLCIGMATRLSEYVMGSQKIYTATIKLGVETDTYDADGQIIATADTSYLTPQDIEATLLHFQGDVEQVPPMYSAIKQGGKKLYELARQGKEIDRPSRQVHLQTELLELDLPILKIRVTCSAGTYIRSIAHELGALLGVGAHLTQLRRDASGSLHDPVSWDTLVAAMADGTWAQYLVDERLALSAIPELHLTTEQTQDILQGRSIPKTDIGSDLCRAYSSRGQFIAILSTHDNQWRPAKVFLPE
jgi:tRNA pseudouridine55 synthase